jgi:DNA polymerase-1
VKFKSPIPNLWERELDFMDCLMTMESRGVRIDQAMARREEAIGTGRMIQIIKELGGLKPTSSTDLKKLLIDKIGLPILWEHCTPKGKPSFDKKAMEDYDALLEARGDEFGNTAKLVTEYRGWSKTVSSNYIPYQRLLGPDGRLRPNYWMHGTKTGRLSCREPNLQQIPKESTKRWNGHLKKVFIPKPNYVLLNVDYSQLELRLASAYAKQENWLQVFNTVADSLGKYPDVFTAMSETMGMPRGDCKTITYAKMFGAQAGKIALLIGGDPVAARNFIKQWEEEHDRIVELTETVNAKARARGYIYYWTGRQRHFPYPGEARKAFNSLIQGGGAEIVKSAMLRLFREVDNPECQMLLQVHDAVVFEVLESKVDYYEPIIKELMQDVKREIDFRVSFNVESEFWGDYEKAA